MLEFIKFLDSLRNMSEEEIKNAISKKIEKDDVSNYDNFINPGNIVDIKVDDKILHGIVLANKALLLIDPNTHTIKGYLKNYTDIVPYKIMKIRVPNESYYKYTDDNIPVVWEALDKKTEMSMEDIEKALGIKSGTLVIK